ncbi:M23 family metallopeptidase [Paraflavitalea speifideaquila]|uniref:M23 family metallopeptidase n=1 Tax=Paraflavitalea speifideaquila TaxID=3076558 RepID=UPI0028EE4AE1|nr:M23 family metallopeptidase [Paraflavitalea speifideiaquila]
MENSSYSWNKKISWRTDLAAPTGTDVHAMASGKVVRVAWDGNGFGRYVVIQHRNGYYTIYGHLEKNGVKVKVGDKVADGENIASSGNTGGSTGPHLHLELVKANSFAGVFDKKIKWILKRLETWKIFSTMDRATIQHKLKSRLRIRITMVRTRMIKINERRKKLNTFLRNSGSK